VSDSEIDVLRYYKATTFGLTFAAAGAVAFTNTARGRDCYAPEHIRATRDGSGNITGTFSRRSRIGDESDWTDGVAAPPLGEASAAYVVEVYSGAVLKRTISGLTAEAFSYSAADQTTDFGSPQAAVLVHVRQVSATNGPGRPGIATI